MRRFLIAAATLAAIAPASVASASAASAAPASAQSRIALVIGNAAYQNAAPLKTTIADAGLVTSTLQAAGYDVTAVNDVTKDNFGADIRSFLDKVTAAGPDAVAFVYFAGYGAQLNADSYLVPVDAEVSASDASQALPLSALISDLASVPAAARIVVVDASRDAGFGKAAGQPVPPGLVLMGVPSGVLLAYADAPNAVAPDGDGPNSPFASALTTLMRQSGLSIEQILNGVRLQVNQASNGTQTPWMVSALNVEVSLFDAPAGSAAPQTLAPALGCVGLAAPPLTPRKVTKANMQAMSAGDAYRTAVEQDTLQDYQWFVEFHPRYRLAGSVWDIINRRREAILWHRTLMFGTTEAYWNYLDRYPHGAYVWEARHWLDVRALPPPPRGYVPVVETLPPGYVDEAVGLEDVVRDGFASPPPVFSAEVATVFVEPPPPPPQRPINIVIQQPPATPMLLANNAPAITPKPQQAVLKAQPVPAAVNAGETPEQKQQKAALIRAWLDRVKQKNEDFARKYNTPAVKPTVASLGNPTTESQPQPHSAAIAPTTAHPGGLATPPRGTQPHSAAIAPTTTQPGGLAIPPGTQPQPHSAAIAPITKHPGGLAIPQSGAQQQHSAAIAPTSRHPGGLVIPPSATQSQPRSAAIAPTSKHPGGLVIPPSGTQSQPHSAAIAPTSKHPGGLAIPPAHAAIAPGHTPTAPETQRQNRPALSSTGPVKPAEQPFMNFQSRSERVPPHPSKAVQPTHAPASRRLAEPRHEPVPSHRTGPMREPTLARRPEPTREAMPTRRAEQTPLRRAEPTHEPVRSRRAEPMHEAMPRRAEPMHEATPSRRAEPMRMPSRAASMRGSGPARQAGPAMRPAAPVHMAQPKQPGVRMQ